MGQQCDLGLAAKRLAYVGHRCISQNFPRQVLRRIEDARGRRGNDTADIHTFADKLLHAWGDQECVHWCDHNGPNVLGKCSLNAMHHRCRVVVGECHAELHTPISGGSSQASRHALHELSLVVLRKDKATLKASRFATRRHVGAERCELGGRGNPSSVLRA